MISLLFFLLFRSLGRSLRVGGRLHRSTVLLIHACPLICSQIFRDFIVILIEMIEKISPKGPDPITQHWFLCGSPWPIVFITIFYLLSVPFGKRWMSQRSKPFDVRHPMVIYNILAILVNAYVVYLSVKTLTLKSYRIFCQGVMHDQEDRYLAEAVWWYFISKAFEFWDTWFFILTKKFSHVSILHVYHHATMFPLWYLAT